jgi:hypothetical protein
MPTLADVLRNYTPPMESALADPIKEHFKNLPQKTAQNAIKTNAMVQGAFPTYPNGQPNPDYYPEAAKEFADYAPNLMGSVAPRKEVIGGIFDKVMDVFGKGKIPQMPEGVIFEKLHPTVQAKVKQGMIEPRDAQWMSDYAYTPGNSQVETGTGAWKDQSERMQNFAERIKKGEITNPWE